MKTGYREEKEESAVSSCRAASTVVSARPYWLALRYRIVELLDLPKLRTYERILHGRQQNIDASGLNNLITARTKPVLTLSTKNFHPAAIDPRLRLAIWHVTTGIKCHIIGNIELAVECSDLRIGWPLTATGLTHLEDKCQHLGDGKIE